MKLLIRIMLCLASACMIWGNLHTSIPALMASLLFFISNVAALIYNEVKK
jgi:hypothetical protein